MAQPLFILEHALTRLEAGMELTVEEPECDGKAEQKGVC